MSACISLAFATPFGLDQLGGLLAMLGGTGPLTLDEGMASTEVQLGTWPATLRVYDEDGWLSLSVDIQREVYDVTAAPDRGAALDQLIAQANLIGQAAGSDYVHIDEEAEAETPPGAWTEDQLFGITVVRAGHPRLGAARARADVVAVRRGSWGVALLRRLDPVPELG